MDIARQLKSKVSIVLDYSFSYYFFGSRTDFKVLTKLWERFKCVQIFIRLHCYFTIFLSFLSVGASLMLPPPLSAQKLSAI